MVPSLFDSQISKIKLFDEICGRNAHKFYANFSTDTGRHTLKFMRQTHKNHSIEMQSELNKRQLCKRKWN